MIVSLLIGLSSIIILGIAAEWLSWRIRLPSILLLLLFGFIAGPLTGFLKPDVLFGDILIPLVSLAVAIILFEGGLNLRISELRTVEGVVIRLISLGTLASWIIGTAAAYYFLKLDLGLATLLGAILIVTGPTVIIPMLRHLKMGGRVASILKWEGIVIDPIGAVLAIIVFQVITVSGMQDASIVIVFSLIKPVLINGSIGALAAYIVILLLRSYLIPDYLHSAVTLAMEVLAFTTLTLFMKTPASLRQPLWNCTGKPKTVSVRHKQNLKKI
jgi:NhaP-type Na+/H+ or K+/H+ antiporter